MTSVTIVPSGVELQPTKRPTPRGETMPLSMVTHGVPVTHADVVYSYRGMVESITVGASFIGQSPSLHVAAISRVLRSRRL